MSCPCISAGSLRKRFAVQQNVPAVDSFGGEVQSWQTVITLWGEFDVSLKASGEREFASQQVDVRVTTIVMRYWSGMNTRLRLLYKGRAFAILAVVNVGELNHEMRLRVEEQD